MDRASLKLVLSSIKGELESIYKILDIEGLKKDINKIKEASYDATFWLDNKKAQKELENKTYLEDKLNEYLELENIKDNLDLIYEISLDEEEHLSEADSLIDKFSKLYKDLETATLLKDKEDSLSSFIEIHSGAGGTESLDWVQMLFRMYEMYASKHKFKLFIDNYQRGEEVGIKSVSFRIEGKNAYGYLKGETGVHRLVRLSPFDKDHARHTTFASVNVSPIIDEDIKIDIKDEDIRIDIFHASGAGGQGVNTTDSAVRITHIPTKIIVTCQNERSQIQNKEMAFKVLRSRLYQLELDRRKEEKLKSLNKDSISFGSQIRSYVFHPYSLIKDHRTLYETSQVSKVMDGDLDDFINEYLKKERLNG